MQTRLGDVMVTRHSRCRKRNAITRPLSVRRCGGVGGGYVHFNPRDNSAFETPSRHRLYALRGSSG